ncbi:MAG: hypothetical protein WBA44_01695 [Mesorhizobium sp.]
MIGFFLRSAFWLSLVLIAIPFGGTTDDGRVIGPFEALSSARAAAADMMAICDHQPRVCDTSRFVAAQVDVESVSGLAKMVLPAASKDLGVTGSVRPETNVAD